MFAKDMEIIEGPKHFDIGIEFLEMSKQDEEILKAFINSLQEKNKGLSSHRGISSNLSSNGLFISANRPFPPDTMLDIVIHLPNRSTSKLKGRVRRALKTLTGRVIGTPVKSFKNGMGVEIIEKDTNYLKFIKSSLA